MRIIVGPSRHDGLRKAHEWFASPTNSKLLTRMASWASSQETKWGECLMLVEPDLPAFGGTDASNVDLILAFTDRAAVCEVKANRTLQAAKFALVSSLEQCSEHLDLVKNHLASRQALRQEDLRAFLFYPYLNTEEVEILLRAQRDLSSLRHVYVTGGESCATQPITGSGHRAYFPVALEQCLAALRPSHWQRRLVTVQATLRSFLNADAFEFPALDDAIAFATTEKDKARLLRLSADHVHGFHGYRLESAVDKMGAHGVVEVIAPFGLGKTYFIREFLGRVEARGNRRLRVLATSLPSPVTPSSLAREILRGLDVETNEHADEPARVRHLLSTEAVVWIESYDRSAAPALRAIIEEVLRRGVDATRCRIVVESRVPLFDFGSLGFTRRWPPFQVFLQTPARQQIKRMLLKAQEQHGAAILEDVSQFLNPRLAMARWRSPSPTTAAPEHPSDFSWLESVFEGLHRDLAIFVICAIDDVPITMSYEAIRQAAALAFPEQSGSRINLTLITVLDHLVTGDFMFREHVHPYMRSQIPGERWTSSVGGIAPALAVRARQLLKPEDLTDMESRTMTAFEALENQHPHLRVVRALRKGDLLPFFLSTHRNGWLGMVSLSDWWQRRPGTRATDAGQIFLLRCCNVAAEMIRRKNWSNSDNLANRLGTPPDGFVMGLHIRDVMSLVLQAATQDSIDFIQYDSAASSHQEDAAAEALCWLFDLNDRRDGGRLPTQIAPFLPRLTALLSRGDHLTEPIRLQVLRRLASVYIAMGRDFMSTHSGDLTNIFEEYFRMSLSKDHVGSLVVMSEWWNHTTLAIRQFRSLQNALSAFADDGNPIC